MTSTTGQPTTQRQPVRLLGSLPHLPPLSLQPPHPLLSPLQSRTRLLANARLNVSTKTYLSPHVPVARRGWSGSVGVGSEGVDRWIRDPASVCSWSAFSDWRGRGTESPVALSRHSDSCCRPADLLVDCCVQGKPVCLPETGILVNHDDGSRTQ